MKVLRCAATGRWFHGIGVTPRLEVNNRWGRIRFWMTYGPGQTDIAVEIEPSDIGKMTEMGLALNPSAVLRCVGEYLAKEHAASEPVDAPAIQSNTGLQS